MRQLCDIIFTFRLSFALQLAGINIQKDTLKEAHNASVQSLIAAKSVRTMIGEITIRKEYVKRSIEKRMQKARGGPKPTPFHSAIQPNQVRDSHPPGARCGALYRQALQSPISL
jgi:hypothetical protein